VTVLDLDSESHRDAKIVETDLQEDEFDQRTQDITGKRMRHDIALDHGRYAGKRSSRKAVLDESSDEDEDEDEEEDEDEKEEDELDDEDGGMDSDSGVKEKDGIDLDLAAMKEAEALQKQLEELQNDQKAVVEQLVEGEEEEREKAKHTHNQVVSHFPSPSAPSFSLHHTLALPHALQFSTILPLAFISYHRFF
jgi:hypothetical protein